MKFKRFFILSSILFVLVVVLNFFAFQNYWYWLWPWFDKWMHFLGGLVSGLVAIQVYLYFFKINKKKVSGLDLALVAMFTAVTVGGLWELLEFSADKLSIARVELKTMDMVYQGWRGSLKDLLFDMIGAITSAILFLTSFIWQRQKAQ